MKGDRKGLFQSRRIVVKVGTSTITYPNGQLNLNRLEKLARELSDLKNSGHQVILVSSGAVGAGMARLGYSQRPKDVAEKQALAAVGQGILLRIYERLFDEYGQTVAQVLLTKENSVHHNLYVNSRRTLGRLLELGIVPIINENDAVSADELKIGDNDNLSAMVATLVDADLLIILSDIDGLYTADPASDPAATLISRVEEITPDIERIAGSAGSSLGTGGMTTKIDAAKIAMSAGVAMVIARGETDGILHSVVEGAEVGTLFAPKEARLKLRKRWIAFGRRLDGVITVDDGCAEALRVKGKSLLAAGIKSVGGRFETGATVRIIDLLGREIARGIVRYDSETIQSIAGLSTKEIAARIPSGDGQPVVHRDDMVIIA